MQQEKILIIKFGGLGDVMLSLDAFFSICTHHKNKQIILLTENPFNNIIKKCELFYDIITIKRGLFYFIDLIQIKKKIKFFVFSHVYDLQTSRRSSFYLKHFYKNGAITNGIGTYATIPHLNSKRNLMHTIERQQDQLRMCDIKFTKMKNYKWLIDLNINIPNGRFALIVPGGSKNRPYKRIPQEVFFKVIKLLLKKNIKPVLIGANDDKEICDKLASSSSEVLNLCSKTSVGNIYLLSKKSLLSLGNDTGPMHVIAKGNNKTLVLFTKYTNANLCKPVGKNVEILNYKQSNEDLFFRIKNTIVKIV